MLLFFVDYMTKWAEAYPLPDQTAETVSTTIVASKKKKYVCRVCNVVFFLAITTRTFIRLFVCVVDCQK